MGRGKEEKNWKKTENGRGNDEDISPLSRTRYTKVIPTLQWAKGAG